MKKVLVLLLIIVFCSCSSNVDLAIDNPTNEAVLVSVDSLLVEVPARQVVWVEMGKGEHQIKLENDSVIKYNFTQDVYMINPTLTRYLMYEEFYGNQMYQNMHRSSIPTKTVNYLGMEIEGNYDIVEDVINTVRWDYGPRETLPETVMIEDGDMYTTLIKLTDPIELYESIPADGE
ncbi:hypothetical protein ACJD0Z_11045 [Flavobacteriaceae bacterium M23B6Z8]